MTITENVHKIFEEVSRAAVASGRQPSDIVIVAATKMNGFEQVREAISAGIEYCGENRVQELVEKNALGAYEGAHLHFIGHLQKNKVSKVVGAAELIHSADSLSLIEAINHAAGLKGVTQDILLEVNIGGEESKHGFGPDELNSVLERIQEFNCVRVRGLMAIPPKCDFGAENKPYFALMRQLFIDIGEKKYDNVFMDFLSMGMSGDYAEAVECGANMVRIGSAIFGPRIYPDKSN